MISEGKFNEWVKFLESHLTSADPENVNLTFLQWTKNIKREKEKVLE